MDEAFLSGLRDLLQEQCQVPALPAGWLCTSAMLAAHGYSYGGDFFIAELLPDEGSGSPSLAMVLVDVCGKGATAVPDAVQFAGALRGLVVGVPGEHLMDAANTFLLRRPSDESIATAVQVVIDLDDGGYSIRSGGHPPVLHWVDGAAEWVVDNARGTALGVVDQPQFDVSTGVLGPGDALLFYTDGVVEAPRADIDDGIDWLRLAARDAVLATGMSTVPEQILAQVQRGDDDRALLVIARQPTGE